MSLKRTVIITFVIALLSIICVLCRNVQKLKSIVSSKDATIDKLASKYSTMYMQYPLIVNNCGHNVADAVLVDSLDEKTHLSDFIKSCGGMVVMFRYASLQCHDCVKYAISVISNNQEFFDMSKMVVIANSNSKRIFKLEIKEYNLYDFNVFNCTSDFNISAEHIDYPYFAVIDSGLNIHCLYAPNKSNVGTDFDFNNMKLMYDSFIK